MKHLIRGGLVLGGVVFVAFILPRLLHNPPELQSFGFYPKSPVENAQAWASQPLQYADPSECNTCHQDNYAAWSQGVHSTVQCENCHGPGEEHIAGKATLNINTSPDLCLQCHGEAVGRRSDFPQVDPGEHAGGQECVTCHNPHSPLDMTFSSGSGSSSEETAPSAETIPAAPSTSAPAVDDDENEGPPPVPHSIEGRSDCLVCHAAGGLKPYPDNHVGRTSDTCLSCHQVRQA